MQPRGVPRAAASRSGGTPSERALGALLGLAIGDALGMPTQLLSRDRIVDAHGPLLAGFEPAPPGHPIAAGMTAGQVTDDTEQAVILAEVLIAGGGVIDAHELAARLVAWEADVRARGSLDLLGPSTRRALTALLAGGDVETTGRSGDTNGAAMRITPVGIATVPDTAAIVAAVEAASRVTHNTSIALAGASAVAAAVSAGVAGLGHDAAVERALAAATSGAKRGRWVAGADVASRIRWAIGLVAGLADADACDLVQRLVGTSLATQESVPAAFALWSLHPDDPWLTCRLGASVGGDCDTIAAMAGAMSGAMAGSAGFPAEVVGQLVLASTASELVGGGFNVMAAAARQGLPVVYAGMHGAGPRGDQVRAALAAEGIAVLQPVLPGRDTGLVVVIVEDDGERSFITAPGAEAQLDAGALARVELVAGDHLYLTGYSLAHASNRAALIDWLPGVGNDVVVFFDPGPLVASLPPDALAVVLARADWVSANTAEAEVLTGGSDPVGAAAVLQERSRVGVVVRCGPDGCVVALPGADPVVVPGVDAAVVDLTGAGDAHSGAFLAQLATGVEPLAAAAWANAAAAVAVSRRGPATGPTCAEVKSAHVGWA